MKVLLILATSLMGIAFVMLHYLIKDRQRLVEQSKINLFLTNLKKQSFGQRFDDLFRETSMLPAEYVICQMALMLLTLMQMFDSRIDYVRTTLLLEAALHVWIFSSVKRFREHLKEDLCVIQETLYYQSDVGTTLGDALSYSAELVEDPMKHKMQSLAAAFKFKQNAEQAIRELRHLSPIHELQAFCNILSNHLQTGMSAEAHEASLHVLLQLKRSALILKRKSNQYFVKGAFIVLIVTCLLIMAIPLLMDAYNLFNGAFKTT